MDITHMEFREGQLIKTRRPWNAKDVAAVWRRHFERMDSDPAYRNWIEVGEIGPCPPLIDESV